VWFWRWRDQVRPSPECGDPRLGGSNALAARRIARAAFWEFSTAELNATKLYERNHRMITKKHIALATLAACALLGSTVGRAQGAGAFPSFIPFAASQAEFPEGVAVDKVGNVYVSIQQSLFGTEPLTDQIWRFSPSGAKTVLADFGSPGGGRCGLAVDPEGNVYMARTMAAAPNNGVYRVDAAGHITLIPGTQNIVYADGLAFDQQGNLYITEVFSFGPGGDMSGQGGIWRVPRGGTAEVWLRHDLLTGIVPTLFPFRVGANGIAFYLGSLYVINTDKTTVVRVRILPDGRPGEPKVWKQVEDVPESVFYQGPFPLMLDGIALDVHGNVYIASPSRLAIVRINATDRSQETLVVFHFVPVGVPLAPLDAPFSLAFGTGMREQGNLFITSSGMVGVVAPGLPWPGPGLVKLEVGVPGLPLP
jgi:sugar lactone lactonase YvrE